MNAACRPTPRRRISLVARTLALALALAAVLVALSGEQWLLEEAPPAVNELTLATCVLDDVYGNVLPAAACTSNDHDKGHAL